MQGRAPCCVSKPPFASQGDVQYCAWAMHACNLFYWRGYSVLCTVCVLWIVCWLGSRTPAAVPARLRFALYSQVNR